MKKIRNKNTGAEISSPYLVRKNFYTCPLKYKETFWDEKSGICPVFVSDGWEEVKGVDYSLLEKMVDDALASESKESLLAFLGSRVNKQNTKEVKDDNSSIEMAAYDYSCSFSEEICKECNNICGVTGDCPISECREKTFKAGAIWMRDKYLNENGWDKVFEEWQKEKENKK